jgi:ABC-2 type transport system permease protein
MLSRIASIVRKEFIQIFRDPRTLAIVLAMPAMQLLLFGYAINTVVDHLPTVVLDQARTPDSRAFIAAFQNSGYFDVVGPASSPDDIRQSVDSGRAKLGLVIPPDFGTRVLRGETALAQLVVDGSDPNVAQTALFAGGMVAQAQSAQAVGALSRGAVTASAGIELRPIVLYNPSMLSVNFMIPGLIGLILQFQTLILTAFAVVRERERGTLEQLVVTPIRPWELMLGKILPYVATAFLAVSVALGVGRFWFGVELAGSLPLLVALSTLFLLGSLGVGLLISTVSQTQAQALQLAMFVMLPSLLLSGFMFPREGMPWLVQQLGLAIPLTYFLQILRGVILKGVGLEVLWSQALPLAVFGVIVFFAERRTLQQAPGLTRAGHRDRRATAQQALWRTSGGRSHHLRGADGRGVRLPGAKWLGQEHDHPHAVRHPDAELRPGHGTRLRHQPRGRADQAEHRLHEPALRAVRGPHGAREPRVLRRHLPGAR